MSKQSGKKDREDRARHRLVKAQIDLHTAQEKRAQAISRAEAELDRARRRGNRWVTKATERVERRSGAIARAEANLLAITTPRHLAPVIPPSSDSAPAPNLTPSKGIELTVSSPAAAADVLEQREADIAARRDSNPMVLPDTMSADGPSASHGNDAPEEANSHSW